MGKPTQPQAETRARAAVRQDLRAAYRILRARNGHLNWWPGRTRTEVIVGAILTQNTAWTNVELAIRNLRAQRLLTIRALRDADPERLAAAIRPSGYFRQKTLKLKAFVAMLDREHAGSLARMSRAATGTLRAQLLDTWGIGPETADSILLYAFDRPVFVVDAYTLRVAVRHGWAPAGGRYAALQDLFTRHLPLDRELYNDYHAQLVWVGKHYCRTRPRCEGCPLALRLPGRAGSAVAGHI